MILFRDIFLGEDLENGMFCEQVERGGDGQQICAVAHKPCIGPAPQCQSKRIEKDGFSSPGFARQRRKTCFAIQRQPVNQHDILDVQTRQHAFMPALLKNLAKCFIIERFLFWSRRRRIAGKQGIAVPVPGAVRKVMPEHRGDAACLFRDAKC